MERPISTTPILDQALTCVQSYKALAATARELASPELQRSIEEGLAQFLTHMPEFNILINPVDPPHASWDYLLRNDASQRGEMTMLLMELQCEIDQMAFAIRQAMQQQQQQHPEPEPLSNNSRLVDAWMENLRSVEDHTVWRLAFWRRDHAMHTSYPTTNPLVNQSFYFAIRNELGLDVSTQFRECIRGAITQECPSITARPALLRRLVDLVVQRRRFWNFQRRIRGLSKDAVLWGRDASAPPPFAQGDERFTCPFCFFDLPVAPYRTPRAWTDHVMSDLEGYVCLYETCSSTRAWPEACPHACTSFGAWFAAMAGSFAEGVEWCSHAFACDGRRLEEVHRPRCAAPAVRLDSVCPLCGREPAVEETQLRVAGPADLPLNDGQDRAKARLLLSHIAGHLEVIAPMAFTWNTDRNALDPDRRLFWGRIGSPGSAGGSA
ncbi:uncharacterized protein BO66DRAFT_460777 [Aspergillus aculeatinus CBS 121060]|uniref:Uncharacterized protein n=1 Tax=Aspergillus aculeatinus CBS 121060 TaxID=1448322 RepID=A0ACD1GX24_9EURO|nr:hypothetical protein BO66DRAFT_460777 [Aspergillus aculeatinus CBS 121060]RAH65872.1 hypothetical protein BO66DRAFT_460777 [Aspergillus aculeatinus CBS 121060]